MLASSPTAPLPPVPALSRQADGDLGDGLGDGLGDDLGDDLGACEAGSGVAEGACGTLATVNPDTDTDTDP